MAHTIPFPRIRSPKFAMNSRISGRVSSPGMISSSFMYLTGLKKCVPRKCCLNSLFNPSDIFFKGIPEVFVETTVPFSLTFSIRFKRSCFIFRFSMTTSIIQSHSASLLKSSSKLPIVIRSTSLFSMKRGGFAKSAPSRPAFTILFLATGSFFSSSFKSKGTMSRSNVLMPAPASSAAIPPPIIPEPRTATCLIFLFISTSYK